MSGNYSPRLRAGASAGGGLDATAVLAAKVASACAALASAVFPHLVSASDGFLRKLYLFVAVSVIIFVAVSLIIFVTWMDSDNEQLDAAAHEDSWAPVPYHPARPVSCGGESFVTTTEFEDEAGSSAVTTSSAYVAPADSLVVERGLSQRLPLAVATTDEYFDVCDNDDHTKGNDDLDATWNAIIQKTSPATALALSSSSPRPSPSLRPRARQPSLGAMELYKLSEDFIKKIHNSFRHQE